jgi:NagD protein
MIKRAVLFDLDGTLYLGSRILPGALDTLKKLEALDTGIFYFTNNSSRSEKEYVSKLKRMGFAVRAQQIVMSTHSLISYLLQKKWRRVYVLGTPAMKKMLSTQGIQSTSNHPQAVVVGFDKTLTWAKLDQAAKLLDKGLPFVVTHPDLFCPTEKGPEPDCGSFALALEATTGRKPTIVLGKPHPSMIREVLRRSKLPKSALLVVGDRLSTDIKMAETMGIDSALVFSGETTPQMLKRSLLRPRFTASSVKDLFKIRGLSFGPMSK